MKISDRTRKILANFSGISDYLFIPEGQSFHVKTPGGAVAASAQVPEHFDKSFGIYMIPTLLKYLDAFQDPNVEIVDEDGRRRLRIEEEDGSMSAVYNTYNEDELENVRKEPFNVFKEGLNTEILADFTISKENFDKIKRAAAMPMNSTVADTLKLSINSEGIWMTAMNIEIEDGSNVKIRIADGVENLEAEFLCSTSQFRMIDDEYNAKLVAMTPKGTTAMAMVFTSEDLTYVLSQQKQSSSTAHTSYFQKVDND